MKSGGKISIIVPAYNLEGLIENTLNSICAQTYKNLEIVVVDDGSKDNTYNIICEYSKKDARVIPIHQENGGVTSARLNGIKHATGEWIGFVDGDDELEPNMYEVLMQNAVKYNADISHCGYKTIVSEEKTIYFYNTGRMLEQDNEKGLCDLLDGSMIEPGLWNKLYKRSLFRKLINEDLMDKSIKNNEDLLMNYYLFKAAKKSIYNDVCLYRYIVHSDSVTRRAPSREFNYHRNFDPVKVREIIVDDTQGNVKKAAIIAYLNCCIQTYRRFLSGKASKENISLIKGKILKYKKYIKFLTKRNRQILFMLRFTPHIFVLIERYYIKNIQDKRYL